MKYTIKLEFEGPAEIKIVVDRWLHAIKNIQLGNIVPKIRMEVGD